MADQIIYEVQAKPINPMSKLVIKVTDRHLIFERGTLRSESQQIPMAHVFDVDSKQSLTQKARQVGTVTVHVTRPGGQRETVTLDDIPMPQELVRCINDISHQARRNETQMQNTYFGGAPAQPWQQQQQAPAATPAQNGADDVMAQLERLGKLRDAGVVSNDEFQAKKAEMLGRL